MIFQYTGQPGHGKTLLSLEKALEFKAKGRIVYACNVRGLDYDKTGFLPLTLDEFKDWMSLPDGAVIWLDESYQAMPKRGPSTKVPPYVDELARHRHRGFDFIFVTQSPSTQVDSFVHDLIEEHYHVRRRYGLPFCHVRRFDRYERNPEKALPLTLSRRRYPKKLFGLYKSTEQDTSEKRVPWFYPATGALVVLTIVALGYSVYRVTSRFSDKPAETQQAVLRADGAPATAAKAAPPSKDRGTSEQYVASFLPRIPAQPWSAPIYDAALSVPSDPPRVFCMHGGEGIDAWGDYKAESCHCLTDQGSRYELDFPTCKTVAQRGQYEPFLKHREPRQEQGASKDAPPAQSQPERSGATYVSIPAGGIGIDDPGV